MAQYRTTAHLASRGELRSPANVAIGTVLPGRATGMIRGCIHSLSLGLWPIQLPRRGSLGYVLIILALSYLYRHTQKTSPSRGRCPAGAEGARYGRTETNFAHIRVSEYFTFTKQIFHREAISLARRANFIEKEPSFVFRQKRVLFLSWWPDLNRRPADYESAALPTEPHQHA